MATPRCTEETCENYKKSISDENNVESSEVLDTSFKNLVTGEIYSDEEHIPQTHSFQEYNLVKKYYTCPKCNIELEEGIETNVLVRTEKKSDV